MKKRRVVVTVFVTVCMIFSTMIPVFAYNSKTLHTPTNDLHLYGYIDFLAGPNVIPDKVWCNANISGTYDMTGIDKDYESGDANCCYVIPGTDKYALTAMYMYKGKTSVTVGTSGQYCGYGGTQGTLVMNVMGTKETITCD